MENSEQANLENKKLISIETTDGCLELLRHSVVLFRQVYQIRDALGFGEHRSRMLNADVDGYRTFRDNYLKLKNHLRGVISNTEETGGGVTFETVERAQVLYNRLIQYRDRVVNFAESKGIEFVDEEVTDNELMTMEKEELPRSAVNDSSLKDMAEHTFLPEEVGTKDDFVRNVRGRLIKAVVAAGETSEYANNLLAKSLDKMPFNGRPKGEIAAEVNRVIHNIYKGLGKPTLSEEVKLPITELSGEAEPVVSEVVSEVGGIGADTDAKNKRNENRVAETPMENADTVKHEAGPVFNLKTLQDKVSQLEKSAQNAQFNLSERSEYLQLKELVKKIEILDGRISNGGLDWESDEKIRAFRLKTTNEQITFLQAQTDGLLQILNDKINQKSESFKNHFGDVMVELRNSMPELDTDFSKLETEPKIEKKTGWWDKDFQKSRGIDDEKSVGNEPDSFVVQTSFVEESKHGVKNLDTRLGDNEPIRKSEYEEIDKETAEKLIDRAEIHGDDFSGVHLTTELLKNYGLSPKFKINIEDASVSCHLSQVYELGEGRIAVIAYIEKDNVVIPRSYYRSNSQGVWRYLPNYQMNDYGEISWFGKGYSEESVTIPILMQDVLSKISSDPNLILEIEGNPEFVFAGTSNKYAKDNLTGDYYQEVERNPERLDGEFYAEHDKTHPESIVLSVRQSPNFSNLLTSWEQQTDLYGKVTVDVFSSNDGELKFMFYRDSAGRSWIGGIENSSKMQTTGLKKTWIEGGDLTTPAFEYKTGKTDQTGGYGNDDVKKGPYVDMYENYLKKIPVIQEYIQLVKDLQKEHLIKQEIENNSSEPFIPTQEMRVDAGISEPDSSPETGVVDFEKLKDNYQTSGEKLHATNAELIALDKELAENMAMSDEDWVLQKRKRIWQQMDLKDLEYMRTKRDHLRNYQNWVKVWTFGTEAPMPAALEFERNIIERKLASQNENTKKRFLSLKRILKGTPTGMALGAVMASALGNGEIPDGGKNLFDISGYSPEKMPMSQVLADSGDEMPVIKTFHDVEIDHHEAPKLDNVVLPDSLPEVATSPETVVPPTDSSEIIPKLSFSESTVQGGVNDNNIFSDKALQSGHDAGVELKYPENINPDNLVALEKMESNRFLVEVPHDVYWNIMEGQTNAGDLPFLSKINLDYKQALIDLVRDRIDADSELRSELGFGKDSADQTYIGEEINIELLNKIAEEVAAQNNFLLPGFTLGTVAKTEAISPSGIAPVEKRQFDSPNAVEGEHKSPIESGAVIITDSVAEQFKNDFVGGEQAYNRVFNSWIQAIEGFTDGDEGWFSNLFGKANKSAFAVLEKMTVAELDNLAKLSSSELRKEVRLLELPIAEVRAWLDKFTTWMNSRQLTGIKSADEFSKLAKKAFVLEKLIPSPKGEEK